METFVIEGKVFEINQIKRIIRHKNYLYRYDIITKFFGLHYLLDPNVDKFLFKCDESIRICCKISNKKIHNFNFIKNLQPLLTREELIQYIKNEDFNGIKKRIVTDKLELDLISVFFFKKIDVIPYYNFWLTVGNQDDIPKVKNIIKETHGINI